MLNGYPIVNYGVERAAALIAAIDKPAIMLTGTAMPKLTGEIAFAGGYSGYLGSGIAYTTSYIKELSIEDGIRDYVRHEMMKDQVDDAPRVESVGGRIRRSIHGQPLPDSGGLAGQLPARAA